MKAWQIGDAVGLGRVFLPNKEARAAYGLACRSLWIDSAARHAISLPTLHQRRKFIDSYPPDARSALKDRIKELWESKHE